MARIKSKGKKLFEEDDVFDAQETDTPEEEVDVPEEDFDEITPELLEKEIIDDADLENLDLTDIGNVTVEEEAIPIGELEELEEKDSLGDDDIDDIAQPPIMKNIVKICPYCNEEVLVMDSNICPLCGNPLGQSTDNENRDDTLDADIVIDDYDEKSDYATTRKGAEVLEDKNMDDLFGDLPYHDPDKY